MTTAEFNKIVLEQTESIQSTLTKKAAEYARGDRLSNFKRAAAMKRETPELACVGMMAKHWVSILDMVDDLDLSGVFKRPTGALEMWDEKIGDAINYLILLKALVHERAHTEAAHGKHA